MRYYFIAGEASGDLHGAYLMEALRGQDPQADFRAWGGDRMAAAGAQLVQHYRDLAIMGPGQVLLKLGRILGNFRRAKADIEAFQPDVLVLIDYSGFNLRMAKWAKTQGLRVVYYILPQVWASRESRVEKLREYVDLRIGILPFEPDFYAKHRLEMTYVGHPLLDVVKQHQVDVHFMEEETRPLVALLPGSRKQEIRSVLSHLLPLAARFPECCFVVAGAPGQTAEFYKETLAAYPQVRFVMGQTYDLLARSRAAVVVSGTATLETALWQVPQIVVYRTGALFYWLARKLVRVPYISLVNLILGKEAVPEMLQGDCRAERLAPLLRDLLENNSQRRAVQLEDYERLRRLLGQGGAADLAAYRIVEFLKEAKVRGALPKD